MSKSLPRAVSTLRFPFSASLSKNGKIYGHNYILSVGLRGAGEVQGEAARLLVQRVLIDKLHSQDLTLHVDFLKNIEPTQENLLRTFWDVLEKELGEEMSSLGLEINAKTWVGLEHS